MYYTVILGLLVVLLANPSLSAPQDDSKPIIEDNGSYENEDVKSAFSLPWKWTTNSQVLLNPPDDPRANSKLNQTLQEERLKLTVKLQNKEFGKALKFIDNLLKRMAPVAEKTKNEFYISFVGYLMKDKIFCHRQLNQYTEALLEAQRMVKYAAKMNEHAVNYAHILIERSTTELEEKTKNLLDEFYSLEKSAKAGQSDLKRVFKKMDALVPNENISFGDEKIQTLVSSLRKRLELAQSYIK